MTRVIWPVRVVMRRRLMAAGRDCGGHYRLLQEGGRLHLGSFAKLLKQDEAERQHGGAGERPAQARIAARREETRQAGKKGLRGQFGIDTVEIEAAPGFRRRRQAGSEHVLAIAHAFADHALQFFHLGAALPAGFQMGADLARLAAGQFAIQVAQQQAVFGVAQVEVTHRAPS